MRIKPTTSAALALACLSAAMRAQDVGAASKPVEPQGFLARIWLSGQVNVISQGHGGFSSPYSGVNSFQASGEVQTSRVLTLYTGLRLNDYTDLLFDLENTNGLDLSGGHGLAGFTNLDLAGVPNDRPYIARALLHRVISLSSDSTEVDRGPLQLAGQIASRRIELYAGKMSLLDFFDVNAIGSDSHYQFLNWTVDNNASYGYPADSRGYTYALLAEYHDRAWTMRFVEALIPKIDDPNHVEANLTRSRSENFEFELHHSLIPRRSGVIRSLGFLDHGELGDYRKANAAFAAGIDPTPNIAAHREPGQIKYGGGLSMEQELTPILRAFGRFGWAEGHKESVAFTEANQSFSGGMDLRGKPWKRPDDKFGGAFVANALSGDHRLYLALGGVGALLGDGRLNYGRERILETYYNFKIWRGVSGAADLQYIWNPGYNRDRGPVPVVALRLHLEGALFNNPR